MKFELPFREEMLKEFTGKTMVVSRNFRNEPFFKKIWSIPVNGGGDFKNGHFEVVDNVLRLMSQNGLFCDFTGLESKNGVVYATGNLALEDSNDRVILHEQKLLDINDFGICISSHVTYADKTLPLLLGSIRKAKFDMNKIIAVVGGFKGSKEGKIEGARVIYMEDNGYGFSGLFEAIGDIPYWMMIHDTCEMERAFLDLVKGVDIGLAPDVVHLKSVSDDWMGFYSKSFLDRIIPEVKLQPKFSKMIIEKLAKVVVFVDGKTEELGMKDVYGIGNKRLVQRTPVGIRKFKGLTNRRTL
jgi:hypothetical protein